MVMRRIALAAAWSALAVAATGCYCAKVEGYQPMPQTLPSEGAILHTWEYPIGGGYVLENREVLVSPIWNDVFPLNIASAESAGQLVKRLYYIGNFRRELVGWIHLEDVGQYRSKHVSPSGGRIIYDQPVMTRFDREHARVQTRGVRAREVTIYSSDIGRPLVIEGLSGVSSVARSNLWRKNGDLAAFSTYCRLPDCEAWGLAVVSYGGRVVLDNRVQRQLQGLEFIAWSPDGQRLAALRSVKPLTDGQGGGQIVEVDLQTAAVREVGEVTPELAVENLGRFERIISWSGNQLQLAKSGRGSLGL